MQWSDVTRRQSPTTLRQFGMLCLVVFGGLAIWRWGEGRSGVAAGLMAAAVMLGGLGVIAPKVLQPVFTAWMAIAFPIGFVVSRVLLAAVYYAVLTPVAIVFRAVGRDALRLHRRDAASYWASRSGRVDPGSYFRQS